MSEDSDFEPEIYFDAFHMLYAKGKERLAVKIMHYLHNERKVFPIPVFAFSGCT